MIEIILNRLRGTGDVFYISKLTITGNILYSSYIALIIGFIYYFYVYGFVDIDFTIYSIHIAFMLNEYETAILFGLISGALYILGESMGWGKWVGYLTADKAPENYDDMEGYDFPYIHKTANLIVNERKNYKLYCQVALSLRGFYWWVLPYLFMAYIDLISYFEAVVFSVLLGILFPAACEIGKRLNYNGKLWKINYSKGWENQELVYGLFQGLFFNYVIITNII